MVEPRLTDVGLTHWVKEISPELEADIRANGMGHIEGKVELYVTERLSDD